MSIQLGWDRLLGIAVLGLFLLANGPLRLAARLPGVRRGPDVDPRLERGFVFVTRLSGTLALTAAGVLLVLQQLT